MYAKAFVKGTKESTIFPQASTIWEGDKNEAKCLGVSIIKGEIREDKDGQGSAEMGLPAAAACTIA